MAKTKQTVVKEDKPNILDEFKEMVEFIQTKGKSQTDKAEYLIDDTPYHFTPSFVEHNGRVASILKMYVRPSSNRNMSFLDVIDFIPTTTVENVEMYIMSKDAVVNGGEKQRTIRKRTSLNKKTISNTEKDEDKKGVSDQSMKENRKAKIQDYNEYETIIESASPLVVFKWLLVIIGDTQDDVDNQVDILNKNLDQSHEGARWASLPGDQQTEFIKIFDELEKTPYDHTSTGYNYAGLCFAVSAGLKDKNGIPLGVDKLSLSASTAFFDFDGSTTKQAFIAAPRSSKITRYSKQRELEPPALPSLCAQAAANQIVFNRHRAHHIILNDFDYMEKGRYFRPKQTEELFKVYDVKNTTINPMQGFGELEDVQDIYNRLIEKIANIFEILLDFKTDDKRGDIIKAIDETYHSLGYWHADSATNPRHSQIVNIKNPKTYATLLELLNTFTSMSVEAMKNNRERKTDRLENITSQLRQKMSAYKQTLASPTSIKPTNALQVYYDFSKIVDFKMKQIQLVNMIEYINYTAKAGDVVIIHGFDKILTSVMKMLQEPIESAQRKGVRYIFTFDSMIGTDSTMGKRNDMFDMQKVFYDDLDTDVDWCFIGKCLPNEVSKVEKALNKDLGDATRGHLLQKVDQQVLVHRNVGMTNNFVLLSPRI